MWGYDRAEDSLLVRHRSQEEHFEQFCLVLERGFAIHTGHADRLVVEFQLHDAGEQRYLPRVRPKKGISFRIPEDWLQPSDLFLHYDPSGEADIPTLAYFHPDSHTFAPYDDDNATLLDPKKDEIVLPVVKLSTLKGLHYIKDAVCLQMYTLDFQRLAAADAVLAEQLRDVLTRKMERFLEFSHPWVQATHAERIALDYLANYQPKTAALAAAQLDKAQAAMMQYLRAETPPSAGRATDDGFLEWD
jgi:hypothetical protein